MLQAVGSATVGNLDGCGEVGVALQFETELDDVTGGTGLATGNDLAAVRHALVVAVELLFRDEVHDGLVRGKVIRHGHDGFADLLLELGVLLGVAGLFSDDEAVAQVALVTLQVCALALLHGLDSFRVRLGVLDTLLHSRHTTHGIGVALRQARPPEGHLVCARQDGSAQDAVQGEQARVPTGRDHGDVVTLTSGGVHGRAVLRNLVVVVVGVDRRKVLC